MMMMMMSTTTNKSTAMARMDEDSIDILMERTLDVLVVAGWLIRVSVKDEGFNNNSNDAHDDDIPGIQPIKEKTNSLFRFFMATDATVHDVKVATTAHTKIAPKELRFTNEVTGRPVYYGPLVPTVISSPPIENVNVTYTKKSLDPRLEALFEMVHMDNEIERDELMSMMTQTRKPGECHCGRCLSPPTTDDLDENHMSMTCNMCHFEASINFIHSCSQCQYALCSICYSKDCGHKCSEDPDEDIVRMAEELGARFAGPAAWFSGPGRGCGLPSINFPVEVVPRRYRLPNYVDKVKIDKDTQVLHRGVNLKIIVDDDIRQMLTEAGEDWKKLELNKVVPNGATVYDIMSYRNLLMRSRMWPVVEKQLHEKVYRQSLGRGRRKPSVLFCNTIMKLCTFSTENVIFSISAVAHVDYY